MYWFATQQETSTSTRQKVGLFYANLVQNLMNLVLSSESNRKWQKMAKTKIVQKTA